LSNIPMSDRYFHDLHCAPTFKKYSFW